MYFVDNRHKKDFDDVFQELTNGVRVNSTSLTTQGRSVRVPLASVTKGVARFTFQDLCTKALGAADYLVIGQHFHTVFVEDVPQLNRNQVNWVRRFIIFVDSMYESNVKLIIYAACQPDKLFQVDLFVSTTKDLKFTVLPCRDQSNSNSNGSSNDDDDDEI